MLLNEFFAIMNNGSVKKACTLHTHIHAHAERKTHTSLVKTTVQIIWKHELSDFHAWFALSLSWNQDSKLKSSHFHLGWKPLSIFCLTRMCWCFMPKIVSTTWTILEKNYKFLLRKKIKTKYIKPNVYSTSNFIISLALPLS